MDFLESLGKQISEVGRVEASGDRTGSVDVNVERERRTQRRSSPAVTYDAAWQGCLLCRYGTVLTTTRVSPFLSLSCLPPFPQITVYDVKSAYEKVRQPLAASLARCGSGVLCFGTCRSRSINTDLLSPLTVSYAHRTGQECSHEVSLHFRVCYSSSVPSPRKLGGSSRGRFVVPSAMVPRSATALLAR